MQGVTRLIGSKGRLKLIGALATVLIVVAFAFVLSPKASCASAAQATLRVQLVVTARNDNCSYTLRVGQKFAVISSSNEPWGAWPPHLSDAGLVSEEGRSVGSPGPVWEIDYMAKSPGKLVLEGEAITISIQG